MRSQNHSLKKKPNLTIAFFVLLLLLLLFFGMSASAGERKTLKGKTVNINTATVEEFAQVPLITKELAKRIVEYREENGDFQTLEELLQVEGFTRKLLRKIKPFLILEGLGGDECTC
ncbi:MAG: helix-hairpin-helix domain-containing protein [Deltaproteobacteria bacterium]|nr:helix-hairpin-helix domain-containing protein [Deltaproteobacteria bacterium]MBW1919120.1 helix-hairpin-helix domain-containing protein [Deltaproteobacteria bacterium]MBW1934337.1 helix-hairpin-helix domain-containing protein [Deltaproteobacteria bacterium]MBW1977306.1 helix-hairpin-helix domain-containing protein [Deltaproteobacteria bacterium]MBW2043801.1 helix-hairpin-helix domain-containing protein [Deltaproteobacteria bacterium]